MPNPLTDLHRRRELLGMLVSRNLKIRYKSSALGFVWSLLTPGLFILIYAVFARILGIRGQMTGMAGQAYMPFLVCGIIIWQFTAMCFNDGLHTVTGNANLVKKAAFPRLMLPLAMTVANALNFLLTLVVLAAYLLLIRQPMGSPLLLPVALLAQTALCLGLASLVGAANVFFRDVEHIIGIASLAWFFMTPIFYPVGMQTAFLGPERAWLVYLNPMTGIAELYRHVFLGLPVAAGATAVSCGVAAIVLLAGVATFCGAQGRFGDEL